MKERRSYVRNMPERREFVRFEIDQLVEMRMGHEHFVRADGVDLSEKGILCTAADPVDPYTRMFLMFHLPVEGEDVEIKCEGIVVRSAKRGDRFDVAVQFTDIGPASVQAISKYAAKVIAEKEKANPKKRKSKDRTKEQKKEQKRDRKGKS